MTDKDTFFALTGSDRRRVQWLVAGISGVHVLQFLIDAPSPGIGKWGGIAANVLIAYWSLAPRGAPNFWFGLLPYTWLFTAIFDGLAASRALLDSKNVDAVTLLSVANVAMLAPLAAPLRRWRSQSAAAASSTTAPAVVIVKKTPE